MKETVIILGAGASADYDYPLWGELKKQMLILDIDKVLHDLGLNSQEVAEHISAFNEFKHILESEQDATLDRIVYLIDQPKSKHLSPTGHMIINLAGYLLAKVEVKRQDGLWVSKLQDHLVNYLAESSSQDSLIKNHLNNLTVISLNYDRCFEHYISHNFYQKILDHPAYNPENLSYSINFSKENRLNVMKPHGYICGLSSNNNLKKVGMNKDLVITGSNTHGIRYPGNNMTISYGDQRIIGKEAFLRMGRHMYVVDEREEGDYRFANNLINAAEAVFCLGLSPAGICQSSLSFREGQHVMLSNKSSQLEKIKACKTGVEFETLDENGKRLNSVDFPDKFKELVLN